MSSKPTRAERTRQLDEIAEALRQRPGAWARVSDAEITYRTSNDTPLAVGLRRRGMKITHRGNGDGTSRVWAMCPEEEA